MVDFSAIFAPRLSLYVLRLLQITVNLVHPRFKRNLHAPERDVPLTRSDLILDSDRWSSQIFGKISDWLKLDSSDDACRKNSELVR